MIQIVLTECMVTDCLMWVIVVRNHRFEWSFRHNLWSRRAVLVAFAMIYVNIQEDLYRVSTSSLTIYISEPSITRVYFTTVLITVYSELKLIHSSKNWFPIHYNLLPLLSRRYFRINRIETAKTQLELQLLERNFNRCSINRTLADWIRSSERKLLLYESQLNKLFVSWQVQINGILP